MMTSLHDPATLQRVLDRVRALRPDSPNQWGRMSPHGMICHLKDSFNLGLGARTVSSAETWARRTVMKWAALYLPVPWPKGVPTRPEVEQGCGGSAPSEFAQDRSELEAIIARFTSGTPGLDGPRHPIFGPMTRSQWLRWGYLHADHHLRQFGV